MFLAFDIDTLYTVSQIWRSFHEIYTLAICINNEAFNRVNKKQVNILKTFLEYLEFYIVTYWRWFSPKSFFFFFFLFIILRRY